MCRVLGCYGKQFADPISKGYEVSYIDFSKYERAYRDVCSRIFIRYVCSWIHRAISTLRLNVYHDLRRVALTSGIESVSRLRRTSETAKKVHRGEKDI